MGGGTPAPLPASPLGKAPNLCFAAGQIAYKRTRPAMQKATDAQLFSWLALGGFAVAALVAAPVTDWSAFTPTPRQWLVLAFLGIVASGAGFFLWNLGLARVNAGLLAVLNNAKIPLGVLVSLLLFREATDPLRLGASFTLLAAALWIARTDKPAPSDT